MLEANFVLEANTDGAKIVQEARLSMDSIHIQTVNFLKITLLKIKCLSYSFGLSDSPRLDGLWTPFIKVNTNYFYYQNLRVVCAETFMPVVLLVSL